MAYSTSIHTSNPAASYPTTNLQSQSKFTFQSPAPSIYEKAVRRELLPVPSNQFTIGPSYTYNLNNKPQTQEELQQGPAQHQVFSRIRSSSHGPKQEYYGQRSMAYVPDNRGDMAYEKQENRNGQEGYAYNYRPQSHNEINYRFSAAPTMKSSMVLMDSNEKALSTWVNGSLNVPGKQMEKSSSLMHFENIVLNDDHSSTNDNSIIENNLLHNQNFIKNLENLTEFLHDHSRGPTGSYSNSVMSDNSHFQPHSKTHNLHDNFINDIHTTYPSKNVSKPYIVIHDNNINQDFSPSSATYHYDKQKNPMYYDPGSANRPSAVSSQREIDTNLQLNPRASCPVYSYNDKGSQVSTQRFLEQNSRGSYSEIKSALPVQYESSQYQDNDYWSANKQESKSAELKYAQRSQSESKNNNQKKSMRIPIDAPSIEKMIRESLNHVYIPQTKHISSSTKPNQSYVETPLHNFNHHNHINHQHINRRADNNHNYNNIRPYNDQSRATNDSTRHEINQNLKKAVDKVEASKKSLLNDLFRSGYKAKNPKETKKAEPEVNPKQVAIGKNSSHYVQILNTHMNKQPFPIADTTSFAVPAGVKHSKVHQNMQNHIGSPVVDPNYNRKKEREEAFDAKTKRSLSEKPYFNRGDEPRREPPTTRAGRGEDSVPSDIHQVRTNIQRLREYQEKSKQSQNALYRAGSPVKDTRLSRKGEYNESSNTALNVSRSRDMARYREPVTPTQTATRDNSPLSVDRNNSANGRSLKNSQAQFGQQRSLSSESRTNSKDILKSIKDMSANFVKNTKDFFMQKVGTRTRMKCQCSSALTTNEETCPKARKWLLSKYKESELAYLERTYNKIKASQDIEHKNTKQIKLDLRRTFPECEFFAGDSEGLQSLENVLQCYTKYDPKIGYVQGMNFVAASILYHAEEYIAFWILVLVFEKSEMRDIYAQDLPGLAKHSQIVDFLILNNLPELYTHLCANGIVVEMFCTEWICGLFGSVIPIEKMDYFLDEFIMFGWPFFYKFVLALLKTFERDLREAPDMGELMVVFKSGINNLEKNSILKRKFNWESMIKSAEQVALDSAFIHKLLMTFDPTTKRFVLNSKY